MIDSTVRSPRRAAVRALLAAALCAVPSGARAQLEDPAGLPTELGRQYGFSGVHVSRFNDGLRDLVSADLDGDGGADLAVINNARSRIELLLRRREGEAAGEGTSTDPDRINELVDEEFFQRVSFPTEEKVQALALHDMDGDGRAELLFTGDSGRFTLAWHGARATGTVPPPRRVRLPDGANVVALRAGDVDGDGRADVVVCGERTTWLLRQDLHGELLEPLDLPQATIAPDGFELLDLDGDGILDLLYVKQESELPLRWRLGVGDGRFGREQSARVAELRAWALGDGNRDGRPDIAVVRRQSGRVTLLGYGAAGAESGTLSLSTPSKVAFAPLKDAGKRDLALLDVDGDGHQDLVVAEPSAARVLVDRSIGGAPVMFPSLLGARTPRLLRRADGTRALVVAAPDEGAIGVAALDGAGHAAFPVALSLPPVTEGDSARPELLALDIAPGTDGGADELWVITAAGKGRSRAWTLARLDAAGAVLARHPLAGLKGDPADLLPADLNRDGRTDVLVFVPGELPRMLIAAAEGGFTDLNVEQRPGLGLLEGVTREVLFWGDVDGDGARELLVPGPNFARALALDAAGQAQVVAQFNLPDPAAQVACVAAADLDGDGRREVVLADRAQKLLYVLRQGSDGTSSVAERVDLGDDLPRAILVDAPAAPAGGASGTGAAAGTPDPARAERLVLVGADRYGLVENGAAAATFVPHQDFEVPVKNAVVNALAIGDVNGDGGPDLVLTEISRHQLVLAALQPDTIAFALRFPVYEERLFESGRGGAEPREVVLAELTGDGRTDVALLVHDRVIVYPQEGPP